MAIFSEGPFGSLSSKFQLIVDGETVGEFNGIRRIERSVEAVDYNEMGPASFGGPRSGFPGEVTITLANNAEAVGWFEEVQRQQRQDAAMTEAIRDPTTDEVKGTPAYWAKRRAEKDEIEDRQMELREEIFELSQVEVDADGLQTGFPGYCYVMLPDPPWQVVSINEVWNGPLLEVAEWNQSTGTIAFMNPPTAGVRVTYWIDPDIDVWDGDRDEKPAPPPKIIKDKDGRVYQLVEEEPAEQEAPGPFGAVPRVFLPEDDE